MARADDTENWQTEQLARFRGATSENVLYDFFKSLTSLSILTLGGVLSLSTTVFRDVLTSGEMFLAVALIALSGLISFQCEFEIAQISSGRERASLWLRYGPRIAPGLFGGGVGVFLVLLARATL